MAFYNTRLLNSNTFISKPGSTELYNYFSLPRPLLLAAPLAVVHHVNLQMGLLVCLSVQGPPPPPPLPQIKP